MYMIVLCGHLVIILTNLLSPKLVQIGTRNYVSRSHQQGEPGVATLEPNIIITAIQYGDQCNRN